tara:strand:+ start:184 stop:417 length:234 start_codon:yes stop_codon:yes gene_type:complete
MLVQAPERHPWNRVLFGILTSNHHFFFNLKLSQVASACKNSLGMSRHVGTGYSHDDTDTFAKEKADTSHELLLSKKV